MEIEIVLRFAAVAIAAGIFLTGFNYSPFVKYIASFLSRKEKVIVNNNNKPVSFLEIVESWHVLRNQCEQYGLHEAVEKIDEVFPLLNTED